MNERLRLLHLIVAQAAADALRSDDGRTQFDARPFPVGKIQAPAAIVYPGGDRDWIVRDDDQRTFCSNHAHLSIMLVAGRDDHEASWELLTVMAERIYGVPALVKADERVAAAGVAPGPIAIEGIGSPRPLPDLSPDSKAVYLAAPAELAIPIIKLSG